MIKVNYRVDKVIENIKKIVDLSRNLEPVLLQIRGESSSKNTDTIIGGINAQFISQGSFFGSKWKALNKNYFHKKMKKYPGKTILRASDKLYKSVTVTNSTGNVENLTWTRLIWGVSEDKIPYANYHMTGTKKMPARKFLGITDRQRLQWKRLIGIYLTEVKT